MFRKSIATLVIAAAALAGVNTIYKLSLNDRPNSWLVEQQRQVQDHGNDASFIAKAANAFTRLPTDILSIGRAHAQSVPSETCKFCNLRDHVSVSQGTRPSVTNATITSGSTDYRGKLSAPTSATVTVTFGTAYASAPWCDVVRSDGASTTGFSWTVSTTAITISSVTTGAGVNMNWRCDGVMP